MKFWGTLILVLALLLSTGASAFVNSLENTISVGESAYELSYTVENTSNIRQPLTVDYDLPTYFEIIKQPNYVNANSTQEIVVKILPQQGFEGTTYTGMISINLGGNRAEKRVSISYLRENNCVVEREVSLIENKVRITLENNSYKDKTIKLSEVRNLPNDWAITSTSFVLNGFEKNTYELELQKGSSFDGTLEFVFECQGNLFTNKVEVEHEGNDFTGFAIIGSALESVDSELIIDIFLVIIAAILLIAFIARLVRILNSGGKQTKIEVDQ
ncbi:MAG: hypothetical protein CL944_02980 [Candidatus Diapherotrites archaeon]|uniref:Alpha-galactosidase NEW3 domain-containing protein n=1 Tax=Candidatus Iainarchaeum sp. TaxID=3101447 RepID=A0A2D6LQG5_9ARCH|nr:hypothetical protein [Candidatus Diapherotrites archaeon]|tara:strand:- start:6045 stop:6860 length:816 start_codon:yes stop_codon:yes gene_type:complete